MHPRYRALRLPCPHRLCALLAAAAVLVHVDATAGTRVQARGALALDPAPGLGFNLHVERQDVDVAYDDGSGGDRLEVGRIGIAWFERPMRGLRLGLEGGWQEIQQSGRAVTGGLELRGYYAAFEAGAGWPLGRRLRLELVGRLGYAEVDDGTAPNVEIDWWSATVRPAVAVRLHRAVTLRAGARAHWLDGDERVSGAGGARTTGLAEDAVAGGFVDVTYHTGDGGRVGLRADAGPVRGFRLVFERRY